MKVLVGIPCLLSGGTEQQTLNLVKSLLQGGHIVKTVCYFEYLEEIVAEFKKAGSEVECLSANSTRTKGLISTYRYLYKGFRQIIRFYDPDVVHLQYMNPGALASLAFRAAGARRIIATVHTTSDIYSPMGLRIFKLLSKRVFHTTICISQAAERSFFKTTNVYEKGKEVHRGGHFSIPNSLSSNIQIISWGREAKERITIGVVSRLEWIKGMDLVIPAFNEAIRNSPIDAGLLIVGDGTLRESMEKQAGDSEYSNKIRFCGRIPVSALQSYYDEIDILLVPSRSEGFGLTLIEGMARGCVPIVSDTGGLPEIITNVMNNNVGLIHTPGEIGQMSALILKLTRDQLLRKELSSEVTRGVRHYSFERYFHLINDLYRNLE